MVVRLIKHIAHTVSIDPNDASFPPLEIKSGK